jgi:hypothetical protein
MGGLEVAVEEILSLKHNEADGARAWLLLGMHSLNVSLDAVLSLGLVATHIADKHVIRPGRTFPVLCLHLQDKQVVFCITADTYKTNK